MSDKKEKGNKNVSITVHLEMEKRLAFNAYAKECGISPGNLIRNFIHTTVAAQKANAA